MAEDPIRSAAEGVTLGALEFSKQQLLDWLKQFRNKKLAFIKNADNIQLVKETRNSSEYSVLKEFVPEGPYSIQVQMGLALRQIANDQKRAEQLADRIYKTYGYSGRHIAEITQMGITNQLLKHHVELYRKPEEVTMRLTYFFDHIEDLVIFIRTTDKPNAIVSVILTRIESFTTHIMILVGSGYAQDIVLKILKIIKDETRGYGIEVRQEGLQIMAFIFTPELKARISHWSDSLGP